MNYLAVIIMFWDLSKKYAKKYADKLLGSVAQGFNWKGAVNYESDLPTSAAMGDSYTVKYQGISGTTVKGSDFAWDGSAWIEVKTKGDKGDTGDPGPKGDTGPTGADGKDGTNGKDGADGKDGVDGFSPTAKVTKSGKIATITITDKDGTTTEDISDGETNVIEKVQVNSVDIPVNSKTVNIDLSDYVEKENGKELIPSTDLEQITTNKNAIDTLNGTGEGSVDKKIADKLSEQTYLTKEIATAEQVEAYIADPTKAKFNVIYLLEDTAAKGSDRYFEYQRIGSEDNSSFRMTGDTSTDLSDYAKIADVYSSAEADEKFVEKENGKGLSTNDYSDDDVAEVKKIGDKIDKVSNATAGNAAILKADGTIEDSGAAPLSISTNTDTMTITIS